MIDPNKVRDRASVHDHSAGNDIHCGDGAAQDPKSWVVAENAADRRRDISGGKSGCCDLIQQRLEQVIVVTVDQGNPRPLMTQPRRACHAAKAWSDDDDMRCVLVGWGRGNFSVEIVRRDAALKTLCILENH
jgi:hypothetical protein